MTDIVKSDAIPDKIPASRALHTNLLKGCMLVCVSLTIALVGFLILYILIRAIPNFSWEILTTKPSYLKGTIGVLPDILNTIYLVATAIVIVLPLGVGAAIYLTEYAKSPKLVKVIEYAVETLAGIPSIIYGLVGMLFFCQFLGLQTSLLAGSLTLVIMSIPVIIRTTQESLKTVPNGYREGAFGLGSARWHMIRTVVLPCCIDGIVTGCILAAGRMLGESAALLFTAGFAHALHGYIDGITSSGATLTVALYVYAKEQGEFEVAFVIAAILLILCFITNYLAQAFGRHMQKVK
ncbi:MAG: phosphate ABC transporter permease PstA [Proteobacteria bacterium]|uniref:Phosphate transport system permease protein PstA n=1 Tax=Candidatus Avisuccinivibrio stercorigallinarum TaxID=2840704 RepID=A0A9D9GT64_9GAMM|nr:phosphate ABC transporter permease PstA [Candidatus Avisuccinivibrio stercorigallinarum]